MQVIKHVFEYSSRTELPLRLVPLGDIHLGHRNVDFDILEKVLKYIEKTENCYFLGMGDYCLRPEAQILTRHGFKYFYELKVGEEVLGFDGVHTKWTKLRGIYFTKEAKFLRLHSRMFDIECTPNHKWIVQKHSRGSDLTKRRAEELSTANRIIVSASCPEGDLYLTRKEAAFLGWLVTDGNYRIAAKNHWSADINQFKEKYRSEIIEEFGEFFTTKITKETCRFHVKTQFLRKLLGKLGVTPATLKQNLPRIVTRLVPMARTAMFEAMLKAEGWRTRKEQGNWYFSQHPKKNAEVLEAFQILATLQGKRLSLGKYNQNGVLQQTVMSYTRVDVADLQIEEADPGPAWCPITDLGSWVTRYGNQITITGNCDAITTKDRRFDLQSIDLNYPTPDKQYRKIRELFEPIKDKCLGLLHGNHDYIHWKEHNHNYVDSLAYDLGVPYLTVDAYIRIVFKRKSGGRAKQRAFDFYAHHGWTGARTIGGRINRITDLANVFPGLPLYLMGHCHLLGPIPPRIQLKVNQGLQVVEMKQNFVFTGSFLRGYVPKAMSYVEAKTYVPTALGSPVISIRPLEGKYPFEIKVSLITSET